MQTRRPFLLIFKREDVTLTKALQFLVLDWYVGHFLEIGSYLNFSLIC